MRSQLTFGGQKSNYTEPSTCSNQGGKMSDSGNDETSSFFTFRITLDGLIGLAPINDTEFLLPIPHLSGGMNPGTPQRLPERIPPHLACIVIPSVYVRTPPESVTASARERAEAALEYREIPGDDFEQIFLLEQERMTLEYPGSADGATGLPRELEDDQLEPSDPGAPDEHDLAWMPSLARCGVDGADEFDGRLVTHDFVPSLDADFNRLIGAVHVRSGALGSSGVVRDGNDDVAVFEFSPARNEADVRFRQAMFGSIVWEGRVEARGLELVLASGEDTFRAERSIWLEPVGGHLEFRVLNQELEEIVHLGSDLDPVLANADPDFAVSYWMSRAWKNLCGTCAIIPRSSSLGPGGSGEACKNGRYKGITWP
jgi:hypothetical protein